MKVQITRVSSKGRVIIPGLIKEKLGLKSGTRLLVFGEGDTIILKKVGRTKSSTKETLTSIRKKIKSLGITRGDVHGEIRVVKVVGPKGLQRGRFPTSKDPLKVLIGKKTYPRHAPVEELETKLEAR